MIHILALALSLSGQGHPEFQSFYASVKAKHEACFKDLRVDLKAWQPFVVEMLKKADFSKFTSDQLMALHDLNLFSDLPGPEEDANRMAFVKMVRERSGKTASDLLLKLMIAGEDRSPEGRAEVAKLWTELSKPPIVGEVVKGDKAGKILTALAYFMPRAVIKENPTGALNVLEAMPSPWPIEVGVIAEALWSRVFTEDVVGKDRHEKARLAAVDVVDRAMNAEKGERTLSFLTGSYGRLTGAAATGKLIGHPVRGMNLLWSSDAKIKSMDDLKGRVVVLDFWATWCGPCIASMPKLRETAAKYASFPVTVLGVTSVQGSVIGLEEKPIDVKGDQAKEFDLMKQYMAKKEITWPVVFTKEDVFNPEFGIRGIPYTAIIDPKGIVRYVNLHPGNDHAKIEKLVNSLLVEFNLPHPPGVSR